MWIERHHVKKKYFSSMKRTKFLFCTVSGTKNKEENVGVECRRFFYGKGPTKPTMHMKLALVNLGLNNES